MQDEQIEIAHFLRRLAPFAGLAPEQAQAVVNRVAATTDVAYFQAGTDIVSFGAPARYWHVVRSGAVEVFRRDGTLHSRLTEGGYFGEAGLLQNKKVRFPARALEYSLVYLIPDTTFSELFEQQPSFADQVEIEDRARLRQVVSTREASDPFFTTTVRDLVKRELVSLGEHASAGDAAKRMTEASVSALTIVREAAGVAEGNEGEPVLIGIVTDKDIRSRLVAAGLPFATPVTAIMSAPVITVDHDQMAFEAMQLMLRHNIHNLPVLKASQPLGMVGLSDLLRLESSSSHFVVGQILRQESAEALAALKPEVQSSFVRLVQEEVSARLVGSAMAAIGRSFKQRLLELGERALGPPPVPYCFLALGSMARNEQGLVTDQDNALLLDDRFEPERHDAYFAQLAQFVSDGLAACGYPYCTGGIMATNPRWRQPLRVWQGYFQQWIHSPTPEGLLQASIFFDLDGVWGEIAWADRLRERIARQTQGNAVFLACMARNALQRTPPLGFFKGFVLETDGEQSQVMNLKRRGTAPMADLIRVHALAMGATALSSFDRLQAVIDAKLLPPGIGQDLHDALEFISSVRLRKQAKDAQSGAVPSNSIDPQRLSGFERKSLRDAFSILSDAQTYLKFKYQPGRVA
jgi:CBS domain-containing protein